MSELQVFFMQQVNNQRMRTLWFGGCAKNGKDGSDGKEDTLAALLGLENTTGGFDVGDDRGAFVATLSGPSNAARDVEPSLLEEHLAHLEKLTNRGVLDACGTYESKTSGFQILLADSAEEARKIAMSDPLIREGFYDRVEVRRIDIQNQAIVRRKQTK